MQTVIELPSFIKQVEKLLTEDERLEFITWLIANPESGDPIPGANGARKIRWSRAGSGKRGGTRVIYLNVAEDGVLYLIAIYAKSEKENMPANEIKKVMK